MVDLKPDSNIQNGVTVIVNVLYLCINIMRNLSKAYYVSIKKQYRIAML